MWWGTLWRVLGVWGCLEGMFWGPFHLKTLENTREDGFNTLGNTPHLAPLVPQALTRVPHIQRALPTKVGDKEGLGRGLVWPFRHLKHTKTHIEHIPQAP